MALLYGLRTLTSAVVRELLKISLTAQQQFAFASSVSPIACCDASCSTGNCYCVTLAAAPGTAIGSLPGLLP